MEHQFNIEVAKDVGVNAAVIYQNIKFWILKNKANNKHFYDGKFWTYNSKKSFGELFPYLTESQIKTSLHKLTEGGYIAVGKYNSNPYDHTNWYSDLKPTERIKITERADKNHRSITDINTDSKPYVLEEGKKNDLTSRFDGSFSESEDYTSKLNQTIETIKSHQNWKTSVAKKHSVEIDDIPKWIDRYHDHVSAQPKIDISVSEIRKHFDNWLGTRIKAGDKLPELKKERKPWEVDLSNMQFH